MYGSFGATVIVAALCLVDLAFAANPYDLGKIEYFTDRVSLLKIPKKENMAIDWGQPIPDPVLSLLNDPSLEHAQSYLDWQEEKAQRLIQAQAFIAQLQEKEGQ